MSTFVLVRGARGLFGAWETQGNVRFAELGASRAEAPVLHSAPGEARERKHPALAVSPRGEALLLWTEGAVHGRGGALAWQVFDARGAALPGESGRCEDLPSASFGAAAALPDGTFVIVY